MNEEHELEAWLPEALPPTSHPEWEARLERLLQAAGPELARLQRQARDLPEPWLSEMARWWKPAAALAAASVAFLLMVVDPRPAITTGAGDDAMVLTIVASQGDPTALWAALGVPADPVLARLALEAHEALVTQPPAPGDPR
jgi:hypothetical protein